MNEEIRTVAGLPLHKTDPSKWNSTWSTETYTFEYKGVTYEARLAEEWEHAEKPWSYRRTAPRAFLWDAPKADDSLLHETAKYIGLDSIYTEKGEYPAMDRAWRKFNLEEVKNQAGLLEAAAKVMGLVIESKKFSRYAGCSCPCSPGFIVKFAGVPGWFDLFVSASKEEKKVETLSTPPSRFNLELED